MEFPCYMWNVKTGKERLFNTEEEFKKADGEWVDTPAKLKKTEIEIDDNEIPKIPETLLNKRLNKAK